MFRFRAGAHIFKYDSVAPRGRIEYCIATSVGSSECFGKGRFDFLNSWQQCSICERTDGAVVRCSDCSKEFHVSCAWKQGYKFGFEIQHVSLFKGVHVHARYLTLLHQVKSSRRDLTVTTTFKTETGCMNAIVSCKDHDHSRRVLYDICETNEGGEVCSFCGYPPQRQLTSMSRRLHFKCIAGHISKHLSDRHMGCSVKQGVWMPCLTGVTNRLQPQ